MANAKSLLFIPDISGYTKFVQTTEAEHSQHVIAELLEVLIEANTQDLLLAEVEGDALFFYKEGEVPSQEKLLAQIESMFTAFHSHLKMLETNRICPCAACATAPQLQLKIVAHCADLQFIEVKGNRKPFGPKVIEAHRLLKNSVRSENYALISCDLADYIGLPTTYESKVFQFTRSVDTYDGKELAYIYSLIDQSKLNLSERTKARVIAFDKPPFIYFEKEFPLAADSLIEFITNFKYRHHWVKGVDSFEYDENEVTRLGSEHICVIDGKHLNIVTVTKEHPNDEYLYGEMTKSVALFEEFYTFYGIRPLEANRSLLYTEAFWKVRSPLKNLIITLFAKSRLKKNLMKSVDTLYDFVNSDITASVNNS